MLGQLIMWAIAGWCGTPWLTSISDSWLMRGAVGILGGIVFGWLVTQLMPGEHIAASVFGALAGGRIVSDVVNGVRGKV